MCVSAETAYDSWKRAKQEPCDTQLASSDCIKLFAYDFLLALPRSPNTLCWLDSYIVIYTKAV